MRKFITKRRVLKWINEYRKEHGYRPLKRIPMGEPGGPDNCPVAIATGQLIDGTHLVDPNGSDTYYGPFAYVDSIVLDLPEFIRKFIDDFDEGKYPELIAND